MVVRKARAGRHAGHEFWGCSRFPACRATVDIAYDPGPSSVGVVGEAGGSAQRQYERRRQTFERRRVERLPVTLALAAALGIAAFVLIGRTNPTLGALCGAVIAGSIVAAGLLAPNSTTAWATGAQGEQRTAQFLDPLAAEGFFILHDRKIPGSPANIDHIVIGPTGVFVIETKNIAGRMTIAGDEVRIAGRRVNAVEEVGHEAEAVSAVLGPALDSRGLTVVPVICAHRADLPLFRSSVAGIRIVDGKGLAHLLKASPAVLSPDDVGALAALLTARFREHESGAY